MTLELDVAHGPAKEEFYAESFTVSQRARVEDDIRIRVETNGVRYRVSVETDLASNDLLLHWGVAETKERWDEWKNPPEKIRPKLTREIVGVCQTKFTSGPAQRFGSSKLQTTIEGDVIDGFYAINFVLYDKKLDQWIHNKQGGFWHVHLPQPPQPETVTRTVTRTEEYEDEIEEEEEYEEEVEEEEEEEEEETASTPMVNLDLHAQASVDAPVKEEAISSSSSSTTTTPSNMWRRLLTPPVDPKPFTGASDDIDGLMQSLMAERQGSTDEKPATSAANGRDDGENDDRDDNEGEEDAIVRDVDEKPPKKLKRGTRMVKRSITRTRSVTDSVEEPLPVKLVEGPWLVTNTMRETVASEREVQFQIGALVEKDPEGGGVRLRIEAEVPWNLVLHWGIVPRGARTDVWALPPEMWRPDGSVVHKDKACETRMIRAENPLDAEKSISFAELELGNAPTAIRFVLKEDGGSRWIDFNGDDFVIPMPEAMYASSTLDLTGERSKEAMSVAAAAAARAAEMKLDPSTLEPLVDSASEYDVDVATTTTIPEKTTTEIAEKPFVPIERKRAERSAVGNGREVLLQGFNWESCKMDWYQYVEKLAPTIAEYGFSVIWLPPPTDSVSQEGYMPRDYYSLDSCYGDKHELKSVISALHDNGILVLGDAVLNHRCAHFQDERGLWNKFGGKLDWDSRAIVCNDPNFGGRGNHSDGDFFHAAPNIDHSQPFVKADLEDWMSWLMREVGYDGWRLDYVRGFWGGHVKDYMEATNPQFAVGEYWDALAYNMDAPDYNQDAHRQRIVNWMNAAGGLAGAFDVTTKGILHAVFERQEYWRLSDQSGKPPGVMGWWPSRAVTFIENHDTGSTQGHWRFPRGKELQGYAYILTHPGTPTVFWDHLFDNDWGYLQQPIQDMIRVRKQCGIHCRSEVKIVKCEQSVYAAVIDDVLLMKIGPGEFHADGHWECVLSGQDYAIWRKKGANAALTR